MKVEFKPNGSTEWQSFEMTMIIMLHGDLFIKQCDPPDPIEFGQVGKLRYPVNPTHSHVITVKSKGREPGDNAIWLEIVNDNGVSV